MKTYGLCPIHYLSAPDLTWDVMLNLTKIELEVITDPDMFIFFEKCARNRKRYSKTNNKYLKSYDPKQESKDVIYLGANNLHGDAMSKFLLTREF